MAQDIYDSGTASTDFAITPDNAAALALITRGIYVGVSGDITLRLAGSTADTVYKAVPQGTILPVRAKYVRATGTTATNLIGMCNGI